MAETKYLPSKSGYTSDRWLIDTYDNYYQYLGKAGWSISTSTMIQGSVLPGAMDGAVEVRCNYYGIAYYDFAAIRTKNLTHKPTRIRIRLKSHTGSVRTLYVRLGKGMAKDSFAAGTRPVLATGTAVKTVSCPANDWCELTITDAAWLAALVDPATTCIYINRNASGTKPNDAASYCELDGQMTSNDPELNIDWEERTPEEPPVIPPSPTPPSIGRISTVAAHPATFTVTPGSDAAGVFAASELYHEFEFSNDGGTTWGATLTSEQGVASVSMDAVDYFTVSAAHYYNQNCKMRVRTKTPAWTDESNYYSDWVVSDLFSIDFRVTIFLPLVYGPMLWKVPENDFGNSFSRKTISRMRLRGKGGTCRITPVADGVENERVSIELPDDPGVVDVYVYARGITIGFIIDNGEANEDGGYDPIDVLDIEAMYDEEND